MSDIRAYDLGRFQRLVGVEAPRISGKFAVLSPMHGGTTWITPIDVTIWDEGKNSGIVFYSSDFTAGVTDGVAEITAHRISSNKRAELEDVWDEMLAVLVAVADAANYDAVQVVPHD